MAAIVEVDYFNSFWTKRIHTGAPCTSDLDELIVPGFGSVSPRLTSSTSTYPGPVSFGDAITGLQNQNLVGDSSAGALSDDDDKWPAWWNSAEKQKLREGYFIEDSRIRGGYGNTQVNLGVRAYINEDDPTSQRRFASLIYSGPYNGLTGFNETNVFSVGESIIKSVDPAYRSIQKLYADDTNLLILQENKSSYALIDKDAIYSAEGSGTVTSTNLVIGQVVPYLGEYGISQNPESFATFGFQKYYVDKDRSTVMRLSRDGLTEIANYGMVDYFRDQLGEIDNSFKLYYTTATVVSASGLTSTFTIENPDHELEVGSEIFTTVDGINYTPTGSYVENITDLGANQFTIDCKPAVNLIVAGAVTNLSITSAGTGYVAGSGTNDTTVPIAPTPGIGVGLTIDWTSNALAPNELTSVIINQAGSGYVSADTVTLSGVVVTTDAVITVTATPTIPTIKLGSYKRGRILGGYDIYSKHYITSLQTVPAFYSTLPNTFQTLSFDEQINGWVSRYSYKPTTLDSLENTYYTTDTYKLYKQFDDTVANKRGYFYDNAYAPSSVTFIANGEPTTSKVFQTISYEGSSGWNVLSFDGDFEGEDFRKLNGLMEEYEQYQDQTTVVYSYLEGKYELSNPSKTGVLAQAPPFAHAGFNRKENKYVANLVQKMTDETDPSTYPPRPGEIIFGNTMSGIKGFYATITMITDSTTEVGGEKELFSVASKVVKSS